MTEVIEVIEAALHNEPESGCLILCMTYFSVPGVPGQMHSVLKTVVTEGCGCWVESADTVK